MYIREKPNCGDITVTKEQAKILEAIENDFVPLAGEIFGDNLASIMLYGSAVKGRFSDGVSDVNVLVLVSDGEADKNKRRQGQQ